MDNFRVYFLHMYSRKPWKLSLQAYLCYLEHIPTEVRRFDTKGLVGKLRSSITNVYHPTTSVVGNWALIMQAHMPVHSFLALCLRHCTWLFLWPICRTLSSWRRRYFEDTSHFPSRSSFPWPGKNFLQLLFKTLVLTGSWFACLYQIKVKAFVFYVF